MIAPGTRLGPYEILSEIGSGGMGVVYKAWDSRLQREVAIKVLSREGVIGDDLLSRFAEEARITSTLRHPNVVTIHEAGEWDGRSCIVMELLEGESLREALSRGPLPIREAIQIGIQVAQGLAAAHEKGLVHRDLKPENVIVAPDGHVKILDFGLARRLVPSKSRAGDTIDIRAHHSIPGLVVGTVAYMSPEQVRGEAVDHRSDVFSFGSLFYELVTGKVPFRVASPAETMSSILIDDPPEIGTVSSAVSPALERVIRRCLEKKPERRFHSAHDLAFALDALSWVSSVSPAHPIPAARQEGWSRRRIAIWAGTALFVAILAGAGFAFLRQPRGKAPVFTRLTFSRGAIRSARFAPDGKTVIYGAAWNGDPIRVFTTQADSPESRRLDLPDGDIFAVSPTAELAFAVGRRFLTLNLAVGTLARTPLAGRAPREILEGVHHADWGPSGDTLAVIRDVEGRNRLEYPIGTVLYETAGWLSHPRVSPAGDAVAFLEHPLRWDDRGFVALVENGKRRRVSPDWQSAAGLAWSSDGKEIWFTASRTAGRQLMAIDRKGTAERVVLAITGNLTLHDVTRDGRVLLSDDKWRRRLFYKAPSSEREIELSWLDWTYPRGFSSDFGKLLFDEGGDGGGEGYAVYLRTSDGGPAVQLGRGNGLALSPDGRWALTSSLTTPAQLVLLPTGVGQPQELSRGTIDHRVASFLPDGQSILFSGRDPNQPPRLFLQRLSGGPPEPVSQEGVTFVDGMGAPISPDGKSVAVQDPDGVTWVYPIAGGTPTRLTLLLPGEYPLAWGKDSQSLYVFRGGEIPARVFLADLATGRRSLYRELLPADPAGIAAIGPILIRPDGAAYAYGTPQILSDLYTVSGLK